MKMSIREELFQIRESFVASVNSGRASDALTQTSAGSLLREIRNGEFQKWAMAVNALGKATIFTDTVEVIGEFDAISIHEIRFGSRVDGETLMIGYHLYPEGSWKIWTANIVLPLNSTRVEGAE